MRTHIVADINLPSGTCALVKKHVQVGDRMVFQTIDQELTVTVSSVINGPGLMKGWALVEWKKEVGHE